MQQLIEYITRSLVENPDQVHISSHRSGPNLYIEVTAAPGDVGRLIGRRGRTAQAIRAVARVAAARQGLRVTIDID